MTCNTATINACRPNRMPAPCKSRRLKENLRQDAGNDNDLFLDDIEHTCMLQTDDSVTGRVSALIVSRRHDSCQSIVFFSGKITMCGSAFSRASTHRLSSSTKISLTPAGATQAG